MVMRVDKESIWRDPHFAELPQAQRDRVVRLIAVLESVEPRPGYAKPKMCGPGGVYDRLAKACPCSASLAQQIWHRWRDTGDWRCLYDQRTTPKRSLSKEARQREQLAEKVRLLAETRQRSTSEALKDVRALVMAGELPGFEEYAGRALPPGFSDTSLRSYIRKADLRRKREGLKATMSERTSVLTTRKGLLPGQIYEFDDVQHDNYVKVGSQSVRVLEFACQDVASGYITHHGACAALKRGEGEDTTPGKAGTRQALSGKMALAFIAYQLRYVGYAAGGCELRLEHATTSLPPRVLDLLLNCGEGFRIRCGGINGWQQKALGGYSGTPGGNPHNKAHKEQQWSSMHNMLSYLPGQIGQDRLRAPEETAGLLAVQEQANLFELALRQRGLHHLADALHSPLLTFAQFMALLNQKYVQYNERRDHNMEGWSDKQIMLYTNDGIHWLTENQMTDGKGFNDQQRAFFHCFEGMSKSVNMNPAEVWGSVDRSAKAGEWRYLPLPIYVDMLRSEKHFGKRVQVRGGYIRVQDKYVSSDTLVFRAEMYTPKGERLLLNHGDEFLALLNPVAEAPLIILSESGKILGECPQTPRTSPLDEEMTAEQIGRVRSLQQQAQMGQQLRLEKDTRIVHARQVFNMELAKAAGIPLKKSALKRELAMVENAHAQTLQDPSKALAATQRARQQLEDDEVDVFSGLELPTPAISRAPEAATSASDSYDFL